MAKNNPTPAMVTAALEDYLETIKDTENPAVDVAKVVRYGAFVGSVIESHATLSRAMDYAREMIGHAAVKNHSVASGTVILADSMTQSKGRFTRSWHAPEGGVWGCMIHGNNLLPQSRHFIPMGVGVACLEALIEMGVDCASIRWVNDVLLKGRKIAGFLVEGYTESIHSEEFTLVGFGINLNNCFFPEELDGLAISLKQHLNTDIPITSFTAIFLARLRWNFGLLYHEEERELAGEGFSGPGGHNALLDRWLALSDSVGRNVVYGFDVMTEPQYNARVLKVNPSGGLVMQLEDGHEKTEYSGEVRYLD